MDLTSILVQLRCRFCGAGWMEMRIRNHSFSSIEGMGTCPHCQSGEVEPVPKPKPLSELFPAEGQ